MKSFNLKLAVLIWLGINLAPGVLLSRYAEEFWYQNPFYSQWQMIPLLVSAVFLPLAEVQLFSLVFSLVYGRARRRIFRYLAFAGMLAFATVYSVIMVWSWMAFSKTGIFLTLQDLAHAQRLADIRLISEFGPAETKLIILSFLLGFAVALGGVTLLATKMRGCSRNFWLSHLFASSLIVCACALVLRATLNSDLRGGFQRFAGGFLSPSYSFYGAELILGRNRSLDYQETQLNLQAAYSVSEYAHQITKQFTKKNIVLIVVEALREDSALASIDGRPIMPTVSGLARNGVYFRNAYAAAPDTEYSITSIVTGQYPLRIPYRDSHSSLNYPFARIYDLLGALGYRTAYLTHEWFLTSRVTKSPWLNLYFDIAHGNAAEVQQYLSEESHKHINLSQFPSGTMDKLLIEIAQTWIKQNPKPFFLGMYLETSHFPYNPPAQVAVPPFEVDTLTEEPGFFWYRPEIAALMKRRYHNDLNYVDGLITALKRAIDAEPDAGETIFIITGDHGDLFQEHGAVTHGGRLHEGAIRVPLVISDGSPSTQPQTLNAIVQHVDIAPTILSLLGLPAYGGFQGRALLGSAGEAIDPGTRPIYVTGQVQVYEDAIVDWPWKLVLDRRGTKHRLFNLGVDPGEEHDLYASRAETSRELEDKLNHFRNSQLTYYMSPQIDRKKYFPPQW